MATRAPSTLDTVRTKVRRFQLIVGLGFISVVIGAPLSASIIIRIAARLTPDTSRWVTLPLELLLQNLWLFGVLPALAWVLARVIPLNPLPTALGAVVTGEAFINAVSLLTSGIDGVRLNVVGTIVQLLLFSGGVAVTYFAIERARKDVAAAQVAAEAKAVNRKSEYDEFLKEAERIAAKKDAAPVAADPSVVAAPVGEPPAEVKVADGSGGDPDPKA